MKPFPSFVATLLVSIFYLTPTTPAHAGLLQDVLANKQVSFSAIAEHGEVVVTLQSLLERPLTITIQPGTIFTTGDESRQKVMLVEEEQFQLAPQEQKELALYGMCINASKLSYQFQPLHYHRQAEGELLEIARYVAANDLHDGLGQHAVWVVSDRHDLAGIHDANKDRMLATRQFLAKLTGQKIPWYTKHYEEPELVENPDSLRMFSGRIAEIAGEFDYYLRTHTALTFGIYDERGDLVQLFFTGKGALPGKHAFTFSFEATGLAEGTYYARIYGGGRLIEQKAIEI